MKRRTFLQLAGLPALAVAVPALARAEPAKPKRLLRAAHLTDIHVQSGLHAPDGMAAALRHAQGLADRPDMILFGGDCIGDALETPHDIVVEEWAIWQRILKAELRLPGYQCLGNHDIFGWKQRQVPGIEQDPMFGKAHALQQLGLTSGYYGFALKGWHFIVLDSMQPDSGNHGYVGRLDEAQFAWLESELAAVAPTTPVCVLSHIPILSAAAFLDGDLVRGVSWDVPGAWMHIDAKRIKDLFNRHPKVKVCLSGHLHMVDDVSYLGVRYLCNGAVCGGWWKGAYQEFGPVYSILDFFADGTVERTLVPFLSEPTKLEE